MAIAYFYYLTSVICIIRYLLLPSRKIGVQAICAEAAVHAAASSSNASACRMVRARSHRAPRPTAHPRRLRICPPNYTTSRPHTTQIATANHIQNDTHGCACNALNSFYCYFTTQQVYWGFIANLDFSISLYSGIGDRSVCNKISCCYRIQ